MLAFIDQKGMIVLQIASLTKYYGEQPALEDVGFDLRQTRHMMGVLRRVAAGGRTLLLSIHQLREAEQVCDRFTLLADGRIRGVGTLEELRSRANRPSANLEDIFLAVT
jgi:ABC-2 type transport system ATP-binding protein